MKFNHICRAFRVAAIGVMLSCSAACIDINEHLGENLIPTDQLWDVYIDSDEISSDGILLKYTDSLSAYSTRRMTLGAVSGRMGTCLKGTSFTLVPVIPYPDFGENPQVLQFHFSAVRDTISTSEKNRQNSIQNIYVYSLKHPLDSTAIYADSFSPGVQGETAKKHGKDNRDYFIDFERGTVAVGTPSYNGSDSLAFDFTKQFAESVMDGIKAVRELPEERRDSLKNYIQEVPGIYIETDAPVGGGRINMFDLALEFDSSGYVAGNYAELKIRTTYNGVQKDTSFLFIYGPADYIEAGSTTIPTQYAFNTSSHTYTDIKDYKSGVPAAEDIIVEGGCGVKPVIMAAQIKDMLHAMIQEKGITNLKEVVINKATIVLPYNVGGDFNTLDNYPTILSPTVRLRSTGKQKYVTYAGLTDASIESENQGDINRSLSMYSPDISHHIQEILKQEGQRAEESDEAYSSRIGRYDIWMLIMHKEVTVTTSAGNNNDFYNNLLYNSYYNNMMYDPYGYGYGYGGYGGYGYGGYGYGGYGYGNNYYNYMMMAAYANSASTSSESVSIDLDKDRYYDGVLCGPESLDEDLRPRLQVTFSVPKSAKDEE